MNVLQRRMFQAGGPSDKLIQIEPVNSELIRYYVQQGYSPLEIQEVYPAANLGIIEQIAREEGGSLNPAVSLGESFTGSPVVTPAQRADIIAESISTPLGNLSFEEMSTPELPRIEDISVVPKSVRDYITNAGGVLDRANLVRGLGVSFGMSEAEANSAIDLVTGSTVPERTTVDTPGLPGLADVMSDEQAEIASSTLGPNQYRDSKGNINKIDSEKFKTFIGGLSPTEIQAMFQAPDVEYGQELKNILSARAAQVKTPASLFDPRPEMIGKPQLNAPITPGTAAKEYAGVLKDLGIETAEELYNLGRRGIGALDYFFKSQEEYDKRGPFERIDFKTGRFKELDDPTDPYPTSRAGDIERGFNILGAPENKSRFYGSSVDRGGQARFGMSADELDSLILQSSIGQVEQPVEDEIGKELQDLENQEQADKVNAEAAGSEIEDSVAGETQADAEDVADTVTDEEGDKTEEQKKADAKPPVVSAASTPEQVGSIFNSPEFISYVANLSKGTAKTGEVGSGLALGSALAAEERSLRDLEKEKTDRELSLKAIESGGPLDFKDRKDILTEKRTMNESVRDYNNAVAAQELAQSVIDFANGDKNLASFASKIGATLDDIKSAAGIKDLTKVSQLSNTKRAQIALTILTNRNIKEILGESGRTISNIDRDIAKRVVGSLEILKLDNIATLKATLQDNIRSIVEKRNEAQRNIRDTVQFLAPYDPNILSKDSELFQIFQRELGVAPQGEFSQANPAFNIDMTGEFNQ